MKHYGDITQLRGNQIEPVSCITGGSPCQDLSIAGKRAGLAGERSGLFMEMIRVIKEMRDATNGEYPKFAIWENVPGAFSSNKGEDFRCVLEEFARIVEPSISIPRSSGKEGKWQKAGAIAGNGWSLAWRLFDASGWGVPQRRKRLALVMDLTGQRAGEILFEQTGVSGDFDKSVKTWKTFARPSKECIAGNDSLVGTERAYTLKIRSGCEGGGKGALIQTEKSATLSTLQDQTLICLADNTCSPAVFESHSQDARYTQQSNTSPACTAQWGTGGNNMPLVAEKKSKNPWWIVRRLTPVECERLQGYPDGYTDIGDWIDSKGKKHKYADSPRYKALGNSIALPQWYWIAQKMKPYIGENPTLGSLFDGLGGFPLIWQKTYGEGTARWASEIEEFCVAVTKKHFPEN